MPHSLRLTDIPIYIRQHITPENKCSYCTNTFCCTYITQKIPTPRSKYDFDHLLWQIAHEGIHAYRDQDGWYLLIDSHCQHLNQSGQCGIYENRPSICREYSNNWCEFDAPAEQGFKLYFHNYSDLLKYCQQRFPRWDG